ncbi:type I-E CRISPR-associated protein Cas6/Cse3/CasE [Arthrobacter sp. efr-133-R2A-120]|uniref:type I-E CRISPR-associated protein Cas6/Cse3/CasE n=1 Tax=Arthrobacter sp. efr-133-R2A-120 TaxID=3040277 RepID=UPI002551185D|nr:type I-E CRISPR-associated protein Cas6/Cse3/CasE [Arthrobacter sp. efr-133-R2A-120]
MSTFLTMAPLHTVFSGRHGRPGPRALNDPQELHRTVMHMFGHVGGESPRAAAGIIFRVEPAAPGFPGALLIRSAQKPLGTLEGMIVREEGEAPALGTPVAFRLAVNAVRRQKGGGVVPVPRDDAPVEGYDTMTDWVSGKLAGVLRDVDLINHDRNVLGDRTGRPVQTDLVDGFGIVEDPAQLATLMVGGVGRAKNYGCGLLTVKAIG